MIPLRRPPSQPPSPPISRLVLLGIALAGLGCSGDVLLTSEDEVTQGDALGFDFIDYVAVSPSGSDRVQETLVIDGDGRAEFGATILGGGSGGGAEPQVPVRYLVDSELLRVRTKFGTSGFFAFSDSTFGNPIDHELKQTLVYQVDGRAASLTRYDFAEVPDQLLPLFDEMEVLLAESRDFGDGQPLDVTLVASGTDTRIARREFVVVRSQDALMDLLWRMGTREVPVLPRVDFSREMVVGAFLGTTTDSTRLVTFDGMGFVRGNHVDVMFRRIDVEDAAECARTGVRPWVLARMPRRDLRLEFYEAPEPELRRCEELP